MRLIDADKLVTILKDKVELAHQSMRPKDLYMAEVYLTIIHFIESDKLITMDIPMINTYRGKHEVRRD